MYSLSLWLCAQPNVRKYTFCLPGRDGEAAGSAASTRSSSFMPSSCRRRGRSCTCGTRGVLLDVPSCRNTSSMSSTCADIAARRLHHRPTWFRQWRWNHGRVEFVSEHGFDGLDPTVPPHKDGWMGWNRGHITQVALKMQGRASVAFKRWRSTPSKVDAHSECTEARIQGQLDHAAQRGILKRHWECG
mmetsp:Transcript_9501/g.57954  ORF Transcript_9501/g.57954 Transcript_9501/m.57954 type:complete len:188 (-) Transcript_9501:1098-1661(-)